MYETTVTVQGWLGNDVTTRAVGDAQVAKLQGGHVVQGWLTVNTWTARNGEQQSSLEIEAVHVGHDLTRGTSHFTRTPKVVQESAA